MNVVVFVGPTLDRASASQELDATYLPPASQGDVYLAARARPWGIGIVDGYFQRVPAVWHKEILWALSRGVHVFGAASMGALRAAELAPFGMRGVGKIFSDFESGLLQDDDEVTIVHSDASTGYRVLSDAMVNIRATLGAAVEQRIITAKLCNELLAEAKATFYQDRSWARLLTTIKRRAVHVDEIDRFQQWLPAGAVNQKREDAIAMLREMREQQRQDPRPLTVKFRFCHTDAWEQVRRQIHLKRLDDSPAVATQQGDAVLSELRLMGSEFLSARDHAFQHVLCQELAATNGDRVDKSLLPGALNELRLRHGLEQPASVESWLAAQGIDLGALGDLLLEELTTKRQRALLDAEIERVLVQQLRLSGRFRALEDRAKDKQTVLSAQSSQYPDLKTSGINEDELWAWYFGEHLKLEPSPDVDEHSRRIGLPKAILRREILREWLYQKLTASSA